MRKALWTISNKFPVLALNERIEHNYLRQSGVKLLLEKAAGNFAHPGKHWRIPPWCSKYEQQLQDTQQQLQVRAVLAVLAAWRLAILTMHIVVILRCRAIALLEIAARCGSHSRSTPRRRCIADPQGNLKKAQDISRWCGAWLPALCQTALTRLECRTINYHRNGSGKVALRNIDCESTACRMEHAIEFLQFLLC